MYSCAVSFRMRWGRALSYAGLTGTRPIIFGLPRSWKFNCPVASPSEITALKVGKVCPILSVARKIIAQQLSVLGGIGRVTSIRKLVILRILKLQYHTDTVLERCD